MKETHTSLPEETPLAGVLHVFVAYDWGDEIDLEQARSLVPAEVHTLPRRARTPASLGYSPAPLRFRLAAPAVTLGELGAVVPACSVTVFDFAAVSVALQVPFTLPAPALARLAGELVDPTRWLQAAQQAVEPLYRQLAPALQQPSWQPEFSEEYVVFQFFPTETLQLAHFAPNQLAWLAGLVRLEDELLSHDEVHEACRLRLSYHPNDVLIPDWAAAVLVDQDCAETLETIELANLQLLEYRHIDARLDTNLAPAYRAIHRAAHAWFPFAPGSHQALHVLGALKVEANGLFERTGNVFKLVGDQYLARVYRMLSARFHLKEWERNIQRKLEVAQNVYEVISDQATAFRTEFLEVVVIVLILIEILLAIFYPH